MKYFIYLACLLFTFISSAQSNKALPDDVVQSIKKRVDQETNPSIVVGIVDKEGSYYFNFGEKSSGGSDVNEHTIYEIGSISKVFTATLLAQQVIKGNIKLQDPIAKYLPAYVKVPKRGTTEITLGNLSDHTSALPRLPSNLAPANPANPYADYTVDQLYSFLSGYELTRDVGSAYEYSNLAVGLLGHILALQAGVSYESLMTRDIGSPLGMKETKITMDEKMKKNLAIGHDNGVKVENWDLPTFAGAGAIRSSSYDMLKFLAANLGLKKNSWQSSMELAHKVRHDKAGETRVGLGWHISKGKNGDVIWHNGGTGGYRSFAGIVKETGMGVVVLTNSTESVDDIGFRLLNPDATLRNVKPSIAVALRKTIDAKGAEAVKPLFYDLRTNHLSDYEFNEGSVNLLGYSYLDKNINAALELFKLNVEVYPTSANAYDSYGEALLKNGQQNLAIDSYKKSVELNPGNTGGIAALEKLGVKIEPKITEVSEETLTTYVGTYELAPTFKIAVTRNGKQLFAQATGQSQFELFAKTEREFYLKIVAAQVIFNINNLGSVESLTLLQNGQSLVGKKID
jgi:CubicO group peptidase (beta-lactamase class C family)